MHYKIALNPLMKTKLLFYFGGLNCDFEYHNYNIHDLAFRAQYYGCQVHQSPVHICRCDHLDSHWGTPESQEHAPIEAAFPEDGKKFIAKYSNPDALNPETIRIPFDNWKNHTEVWRRRFPDKLPTKFEELYG
jgi:hypothetical protein